MDDEGRTARIRHILLKDWDPLRVSDNPYLHDEYDRYIADIAHLLDRHCTVGDMEQHLAWIEIEEMSLTELTSGISQTAENLIKCWNTR
jgi:hypothetical protein